MRSDAASRRVRGYNQEILVRKRERLPERISRVRRGRRRGSSGSLSLDLERSRRLSIVSRDLNATEIRPPMMIMPRGHSVALNVRFAPRAAIQQLMSFCIKPYKCELSPVSNLGSSSAAAFVAAITQRGSASLCRQRIPREALSRAPAIDETGGSALNRGSGHFSMISHTKQAVASTEIAASFYG